MDVISTRAFDSHPRSIAKALSWRALGSIDTFVLSFIITGNFVWAGSIASAEVVTKMVLYYLHERGWSHIKWGLERIPARSGVAAPAFVQNVAPLPEAILEPEPARVPIAAAGRRRR
jgi:uncharacterized membrane protein